MGRLVIVMNEFDGGMRKWNNKCPKCGSDIHFNLRSGQLGASSRAHCGNSLFATRIIDLKDLREGTVKSCDWEGEAVRMWDGSVRFKEKTGSYLFEWK